MVHTSLPEQFLGVGAPALWDGLPKQSCVPNRLVVDVQKVARHTCADLWLVQSFCESHMHDTQLVEVDGFVPLSPVSDALGAPHSRGSRCQIADINCTTVAHVCGIRVHCPVGLVWTTQPSRQASSWFRPDPQVPNRWMREAAPSPGVASTPGCHIPV